VSSIAARHLRLCLGLVICLLCSGCLIVPQGVSYPGPTARPATLAKYYERSLSYLSFSDKILKSNKRFTWRRIRLESIYGPINIDYFQRPSLSKHIVLVFPILGGKNTIENYFAQYFAENGFDTAIIHRSNAFKKPENFLQIEDVLRVTLIRDRIALDFFEEVLAKKNFGSFGLSRGAINAAMLAGVDERLKYNVLIMGASNLVEVFRNSTQPGLQKFRKKVQELHNFTEAQFFDHLEKTVVTDPKAVAQYIDSRHTLMFLSVFDTTVPFAYGLELRREIGYPETVFLLSNHYTGLMYTRFLREVVPYDDLWLLPLDYVEGESLSFFERHFGRTRKLRFREIPIRIIRFPFSLIGRLIGFAL